MTVDLNLPDMDGLEAAQHIRARSDAPMLFITARAEFDDEMAGMASGAAAYLVKPFRPRQLTETVDKRRRGAADGPRPGAAHLTRRLPTDGPQCGTSWLG